MHKHHFPLFGRGLLFAAIAMSPLCAQDAGFTTSIKLRLDSTTQSKDNLSNNGLGVGAEVAFPVGAGKIGAELGYFYKTGDPYLAPIGTAASGKNAVDTAKAGDSRRNQLDGLTLRVSYQSKINETWDWQAGLMFGGTRFRHQYVGDVSSVASAETGPNAPWRDTYQGTPVEGGLKVSPFAGVNWNIDKSSSLELNLLLLNYTATEYVHHPGSGTDYSATEPYLSSNNGFPQDSLDKHSRLVPHLEIAYAFHF